MKVRPLFITAFFCALLAALLALHIADPWQFANDDNGAWFSAIGRTHLIAGLHATRGQDFFTSRATGELVPYLHHPPLPGLILAAAFRLAGSNAPVVARAAFALLHLLTFLAIAFLASRLWKPAQRPVPYVFALAVAATVPMSAFYGKMPDHEVPGLLFWALGICAWGFDRPATSTRRVLLAWAAWALAIFTSWHAAFCVVAWIGAQWTRETRRRAIASLVFVLGMTGLVVLHLLWANDFKMVASQGHSFRHWLSTGEGESLGQNASFLLHAVEIGTGRYAFLPPVLAIGWLVRLLVRCPASADPRVSGGTGSVPSVPAADTEVGPPLRTKRLMRDSILGAARARQSLPVEARALLGLSLGSVAFALLFPRVVNDHAYHGFFLLPFVALGSGMALQAWIERPRPGRFAAAARRVPVVLLVLTCMAGVTFTLRMYRKTSPRAIQTQADLQKMYR